jgi:hypothetical protein
MLVRNSILMPCAIYDLRGASILCSILETRRSNSPISNSAFRLTV